MNHLIRNWPITCLLILPITAQGISQEPLDMAADAFDDQYIGCRNHVDLLMEEILKTEMSENKLLRRAWTEAEKIWTQQKKRKVECELPDGFRDNHGIALVAYSGFIKTYFNVAVKSAGRSYSDYLHGFHYKSLHFYLTVAVQLLSDGCTKWHRIVFSGTESAHYTSNNTAHWVRFGHFLSTYTEKEQATVFGNGTVFTIRSCYGVEIERFSQFPHEEEVLVPGYEMFYVSHSHESNEITLETSGQTFSKFNCVLTGGRKYHPNQSEYFSSGTTGRILRAATTHLLLPLSILTLV
ncbi:ecto-ADP-ribosyltransferase 5 [Xenopus laevis]|uniref:NAD(P)(+)--arginine ADP-ribosyltransferase n=2 Tax=Xenopus laevis TaxID=8355 RepID=A0A1L8HBK5_XENLA|nr:ecto-ADP-ribosyltransferase 5 [Xenopus laevis]OCT93478.1 hypothetical protein XELAEV_18016547mg [Xenopus laevis]